MTPADQERPDPDHATRPASDPASDPATHPAGHPTDHATDHAGDEESVRRLLASVGPADPMPEGVARRLDDVLAGLRRTDTVTAGEEPGTRRTSTDLGTVGGPAARRRRRWPEALVAAATLGVLGVGLGTVIGDPGGGGEAVSGLATQDEAASGPEAGGDAAVGSLPGRGLSGARGPARLSTDTLAEDVQRLEDLGLGHAVSGGWGAACARPPADGDDQWLDVRLDGRRGVLLLRSPENGRRLAEIFPCGRARTQRAPAGAEAGEPREPDASITVVAR